MFNLSSRKINKKGYIKSTVSLGYLILLWVDRGCFSVDIPSLRVS